MWVRESRRERERERERERDGEREVGKRRRETKMKKKKIVMGERKGEKLRWEKKRRYVWVKEINWDEEKKIRIDVGERKLR